MLLRHYFRHDFDRTFEVEAFARSGVQLIGDRIQLFLAVDRQVRTFGQIRRIRPLMFSLLPRCQGLCGSQKWIAPQSSG